MHHRLSEHDEFEQALSWWWTGKPGVLQSMGLQGVRHDWVTKLNWASCKQHQIEHTYLNSPSVFEGCFLLLVSSVSIRSSWLISPFLPYSSIKFCFMFSTITCINAYDWLCFWLTWFIPFLSFYYNYSISTLSLPTYLYLYVHNRFKSICVLLHLSSVTISFNMVFEQWLGLNLLPFSITFLFSASFCTICDSIFSLFKCIMCNSWLGSVVLL